MIIKTSSFVKSSPNCETCPNNDLPEFAFIGRSNVGKSSFINMLTNRQQLAKISSTPGKTKLINHIFQISAKFDVVSVVKLLELFWSKT